MGLLSRGPLTQPYGAVVTTNREIIRGQLVPRSQQLGLIREMAVVYREGRS